jgi:CBS domain-containing protein
MPTANKTIAGLTAADLMSRDLVALPQDLPMPKAAELLARRGVSGAPVLDAAGRCVGVLSATDFFDDVAAGGSGGVPADTVAEHMTADPVMAPAATPVRDLARMMLDADIHRVIIVDTERRPVGIVSSTDLLAALVYADPE